MIEKMRRLSQYDRTDQTVFASCIEHYQREQKAAKERLTNRAQQDATVARQAGQQIIQRVAAQGQKQAVFALLEDGVISDTAKETVRQRLPKLN